jgi:DNA-binding response OmpR family regulator
MELNKISPPSLAEYLRECGYKVFEAVDTDEAMTILTTDRVQVDIVLCDVESGGRVDGFGLARWVRENSSAKIILASSIEKAAEMAAELCEQSPVLQKPYHHQTLIDMIKQLLAKHERAKKPEA